MLLTYGRPLNSLFAFLRRTKSRFLNTDPFFLTTNSKALLPGWILKWSAFVFLKSPRSRRCVIVSGGYLVALHELAQTHPFLDRRRSTLCRISGRSSENAAKRSLPQQRYYCQSNQPMRSLACNQRLASTRSVPKLQAQLDQIQNRAGRESVGSASSGGGLVRA